MILKKLNLKNIRSFEDLEIEFPSGSILLSGEIGTGKTSVLLGIQFALFGLQPGQKGSSLLRSGASNAYAKIEIEIDDKITIIERTIKKTTNGNITQDKNTLTFNNQKIELSTSEMKTKVIEILNYPKEFAKKSNLLYKFTVYTPQEEMKKIIEEHPETRLDTIRHIFGIDRYKRIKENTTIFLQKIKESIKIKDVLISELYLFKEKLQIETERKIGLARETNNLKIELNQFKNERNETETEMKRIETKIEQQKNINSEIQKQEALLLGKKDLQTRLQREIILMQKETKEQIDFSIERLNAIKELLEKHKKTLEEKNIEYLKLNTEISKLESRKELPLKLKEKIEQLENCPTCFQIVSQEHKNKISKRTLFEINDIDLELEQKIINKRQLIKSIENEKRLIYAYEIDYNNLSQNKFKFENRQRIQTKIKSDAYVLDRTTNEIQIFEKEIQKLTEQQVKSFTNEFNKIKEALDEINKKTRIKEIKQAEKNKELEMITINLKDIQEEIQKKEQIKKQIVILRNLQDWLQEKFLTMITKTEKNVLSKINKTAQNV